MEKIGGASYRVTYNQKDISTDISQYLIELGYKDATEGTADEITLKLENVDAFWENEWYPEKGAKIIVEIGYDAMMNCGEFEIDEIEISSMPDTVSIRGISAPISGKLRTKKNYGHENTTLKKIVETIASDNGLTLQGKVDDISFNRLTQHMENDLAFLNRLAGQFGYYFSVRGKLLVFTRMFDLMNASSVYVIDRTDCLSYSIKDKSHKVFRKANVYYVPASKNALVLKTVELKDQTNADGIPYQTIDAPGLSSVAPSFPTSTTDANGDEIPDDTGMGMGDTPTDDSMEINDRVENDDQAEAMAGASLLKNNTNQQEINFIVTGNPLIVAGNNIQITGIGKLSGKYHIVSTEHNIDRPSGWITAGTGKRVGFIELKKAARKQPAKKPKYQINVVK